MINYSTVVGVASWGGGTGGCKEINSTYPGIINQHFRKMHALLYLFF